MVLHHLRRMALGTFAWSVDHRPPTLEEALAHDSHDHRRAGPNTQPADPGMLEHVFRRSMHMEAGRITVTLTPSRTP